MSESEIANGRREARHRTVMLDPSMTLQGFQHTRRDKLEKQQVVQELGSRPDCVLNSPARQQREVWGGHSMPSSLPARASLSALGGRDARGLDACLGRARSPALAAVP